MYATHGSPCLNNFVESDGCARTVIVLLLLTTVGCISYTWGYYEGIANGQSNLMLDKLHEEQLAQLIKRNETQKKVFHGHGLRAVNDDPKHALTVGGDAAPNSGELARTEHASKPSKWGAKAAGPLRGSLPLKSGQGGSSNNKQQQPVGTSGGGGSNHSGSSSHQQKRHHDDLDT